MPCVEAPLVPLLTQSFLDQMRLVLLEELCVVELPYGLLVPPLRWSFLLPLMAFAEGGPYALLVLVPADVECSFDSSAEVERSFSS